MVSFWKKFETEKVYGVYTSSIIWIDNIILYNTFLSDNISFLLKPILAAGVVTQVLTFTAFRSGVNSRVSSAEFDSISEKLILAISAASGQDKSLISLSYDSPTQITITYIIYDDSHRTALEATIDDTTSFTAKLDEKIMEQSIDNVITGLSVAQPAYTAGAGKHCV